MDCDKLYCSTSVDEAEINIASLFGTCPVRKSVVQPCSKIAKAASNSNKRCLDALLAEGLSQLCTQRLSRSAACEWLGKWLLENNEKIPGDATALDLDVSVSPDTDEECGEIVIPPLSQMYIVAVVGPPGSGKTTQSKLLESERGYYYVDANEVMRLVIAKNPEKVGDGYQNVMVMVLKHHLKGTECIKLAFIDRLRHMLRRCGKRKVVFDNFPMDLSVYLAFEKVCRMNSIFAN